MLQKYTLYTLIIIITTINEKIDVSVKRHVSEEWQNNNNNSFLNIQ